MTTLPAAPDLSAFNRYATEMSKTQDEDETGGDDDDEKREVVRVKFVFPDRQWAEARK